MSKTTIDNVSSIDIRKLTFSKDDNSLNLSYGNQNQTIGLTKTRCHYGGFRSWFICPGCFRRVAVVYLSVDVRCRRCHGLIYNSERESAQDRRFRKADKIRRRLGWRPGIANPDRSKPKGMHWKTFCSLRAKENAVAQPIIDGISQWIERFKERKNKKILKMRVLSRKKAR